MSLAPLEASHRTGIKPDAWRHLREPARRRSPSALTPIPTSLPTAPPALGRMALPADPGRADPSLPRPRSGDLCSEGRPGPADHATFSGFLRIYCSPASYDLFTYAFAFSISSSHESVTVQFAEAYPQHRVATDGYLMEGRGGGKERR